MSTMRLSVSLTPLPFPHSPIASSSLPLSLSVSLLPTASLSASSRLFSTASFSPKSLSNFPYLNSHSSPSPIASHIKTQIPTPSASPFHTHPLSPFVSFPLIRSFSGRSGGDDSRGPGSDDENSDFDSKYDAESIDDSSLSRDKMSSEAFQRRNLKPSQLVLELDKHIVGQRDAKRAVAVALRNRWRRHLLEKSFRDEVMPKNILLVGPSGSGKTEIARRLAKITDSPFIKVEATKFTEVGFYGKDVDTIIKDLLRQTVGQMKLRKRVEMKERVKKEVEEKILLALLGSDTNTNDNNNNNSESEGEGEGEGVSVIGRHSAKTKEEFRLQLQENLLDSVHIEIEIPKPVDSSSNQNKLSFLNLMVQSQGQGIKGKGQLGKGRKRLLTIGEARTLLTESLLSAAVADVDVNKEAIRAVEEDGIVFLDEIDKLCSGGGERSHRSSADASAEGVQRDLLPLIEGTAVTTNLGTVHTDHILFIASGAFLTVKPSDLLPELQGRLPIRVELKALTKDDFYHILTVPMYNLLRQQRELLKCENIILEFTPDAIDEISTVAAEVNRTVENIGARRLNTVIESICEELSFTASDLEPNTKVIIDRKFVQGKVNKLTKKQDFMKFVL